MHSILGLAKSNVNKRDDVPSTHNNLERLLHRFRESDSTTLTTLRSIVERLSVELALQLGDYPGHWSASQMLWSHISILMSIHSRISFPLLAVDGRRNGWPGRKELAKAAWPIRVKVGEET